MHLPTFLDMRVDTSYVEKPLVTGSRLGCELHVSMPVSTTIAMVFFTGTPHYMNEVIYVSEHVLNEK